MNVTYHCSECNGVSLDAQVRVNVNTEEVDWCDWKSYIYCWDCGEECLEIIEVEDK